MEINIEKEILFSELGLSKKLMDVLKETPFKNATPIQAKSVPVALTGVDVLGIAQTGTGKTLAFGLPIIERLLKTNDHALILVPTRELAVQVFDSLKKLCATLPFYPIQLIGGESMGKQLQFLRKNPRIIVATPGRLNDHLEQRTVSLKNTKVLVLDEADRMLDMGFAPQIKKIVTHLPQERQTMLFSATMPKELLSIVNTYMKNPQRIEVAPQGSTATKVSQEIYMARKEFKTALLIELLNKYPGKVLVFMRTKHNAKRLTGVLRDRGITAAEIHSNRSLQQRLVALEGFKKGRFRVLVATDIAARGIHVQKIEVVINYDLPEQTSDYVHRIGRTGRAGEVGHAISFVTPEQKRDLRDIEKLIGKQLPIMPTPEIKPLEPVKKVHQEAKPKEHHEKAKAPHGHRPHKEFHKHRRSKPFRHGDQNRHNKFKHKKSAH